MERDYSSIFPLQQDELIPINSYPDLSIWEGFDHILFSADDHHLPKVEGNINNGKNELPNNLQIKIGDEGGAANQEMEKKIMHREIERQRRKEMADLYSSLRSVLPANTIKGMRSASDQIHEATKYIRNMKNKVRQLEMKRDNMKKSQEKEKLGLLREKGSCSKSLPTTVAVQRCSTGVEVLVSCDVTAEGQNPRLSRILQLLLEVGLDVVECYNCTTFNGRLNYMIQSQVLDSSSIDLQMLRGKLDSAIMN